MDRRRFLVSAGFGMAGTALAACSGSNVLLPNRKSNSFTFSVPYYKPVSITRESLASGRKALSSIVSSTVDGTIDYTGSTTSNSASSQLYDASNTLLNTGSSQYGSTYNYSITAANGTVYKFTTPSWDSIQIGTNNIGGLTVTVASDLNSASTSVSTASGMWSVISQALDGGDYVVTFTDPGGNGYMQRVAAGDFTTKLNAAIQSTNTGGGTHVQPLGYDWCGKGAAEEELGGGAMAAGTLLGLSGVGAPAGSIIAGIGAAAFLLGLGMRLTHNCL